MNMDVSKILASLDEEIAKLQRAKDTLASLQPQAGSPNQQRSPENSKDNKVKPRGKRDKTPEGRARIVAGQKARWAAKTSKEHKDVVVNEEEPVSA